MMLLSDVTFLLCWICLPMMQFCMDLPPQVCSLGEVFTKVVEELQNSSQPLASPLNSNSLSCRTLLSKATRLQCLDTKRGKPSLQADHMRLSLYIYGMYVMEDLQNSGYSMIRLP